MTKQQELYQLRTVGHGNMKQVSQIYCQAENYQLLY